MRVHWNRCGGDKWCDLLNLNLNHPHFNDLSGVYVIWRGSDGRTVYVGSGEIADRLLAHRQATWAKTHDSLLATWTQLPENQQAGVERFLADRLNPLEGRAHPNAVPITVNLPGR